MPRLLSGCGQRQRTGWQPRRGPPGSSNGYAVPRPAEPRRRGGRRAHPRNRQIATPRAKSWTAGTPPSRPGRKAHNCCLSGGRAGVSPGKGRSAAEDARSALTRRPARSYPAPTCPQATVGPAGAGSVTAMAGHSRGVFPVDSPALFGVRCMPWATISTPYRTIGRSSPRPPGRSRCRGFRTSRCRRSGTGSLFVDVAAQRAKQLRRGALPRIASLRPDPETGERPEVLIRIERIAMEEVEQGLVVYELPEATRE